MFSTCFISGAAVVGGAVAFAVVPDGDVLAEAIVG